MTENVEKELTKRDRRLMKTSTFEALASIETKPVDEWEPGILAAVLEDTATVERSRWIERGWWIALILVGGAAAFASAQSMEPGPTPEPWRCTIELSQDGVDPDVLRCTGGTGQVLK